MTYPLHYPTWNCPKKMEAREQTIILPYRELYKRQSIPKDKQYWTMSGSYEDSNHNPIKGEFHQVEEAGLISENQFHAIDIDSKIIEQNSSYYPNLNWHCGDFLETMKNYSIDSDFNSAIINCDNVRLPARGIRYLAGLLMFVEDNVEDNVMVISNIMLSHPYQKSAIASGQEMIDLLSNVYHFANRWTAFPHCYKYHGSGKKSSTWMGSLIFVKN